jgi:hypothetical protein
MSGELYFATHRIFLIRNSAFPFTDHSQSPTPLSGSQSVSTGILYCL